MLGMTRYQWTVLFAAWLGWGFDVFDGLLFNYVAPNCVPTLLGLADRIAGGEERDAVLDRIADLDAAARLGRGRRAVRLCLRPHRAHTHADADDAAVCARHGGLRLRAEYLGADVVPPGGQHSASAANGRRAPRWSRRWCRRSGAWRPARCSTPRRRWACSSRRSSTSSVAGVWLKDDPEVSWRYVFLFGLHTRPPSRSWCDCS